jgi:sec-independent protein translocase protein TatC
MADLTGQESPHSEGFSNNGNGNHSAEHTQKDNVDALPPLGVEEEATVYGSDSDPYGVVSAPPSTRTELLSATDEQRAETARAAELPVPYTPAKTPPPPPSGNSDEDDEDGDDEDRGMLRMSFMEHLEELRTRLLRAVLGLAIAFFLSMFFSKELWLFVQEPATNALIHLGVNPPELSQISPMEGFNVIWIKMPLLCSLFLGSPWVLYQVWAFISPGLYKREKRWAVPFILCTAGLFIAGGSFAYFVAFRYGLEFLLGVGRDVHVRPLVSINEYFDLFVNVTLGIGLVFELPVVIFFLTLLRLASPRFLLKHSRYAILGITVLAAVVTPTPDVFNMMIFAIPMVMLFFVGVFASYLLVNSREGNRFPWKMVMLVLLGALVILAGVAAYFSYRYGYHFAPHAPFFVK